MHPHKYQRALTQKPALNGIYKGWERHVVVDHHFHNSSFFEEQCAMIKQEYRNASFESSFLRPSVLAHISLELVLDHLLLVRQQVDAQLYYRHLSSIDIQNMFRFMELNGIADAPSCEPGYRGFVNSQFLLTYVDTEKLAYALSRICQRIWGIALPEQDKKQLENILKNTADNLHPNYMVIFEEISAKLKL